MLDIEKVLKQALDAWSQGDTLNDQLLEQVYAKGKLPGEMTTALVQAQYLRSISLSLLVIAEKVGR